MARVYTSRAAYRRALERYRRQRRRIRRHNARVRRHNAAVRRARMGAHTVPDWRSRAHLEHQMPTERQFRKAGNLNHNLMVLG